MRKDGDPGSIELEGVMVIIQPNDCDFPKVTQLMSELPRSHTVWHAVGC